MTSAERTSVLSMLGRSIAEILTVLDGPLSLMGWKFVEPSEDSYSVYMQNTDGARIYLSLISSTGYDKNDRVNVTGWFNIGKAGAFVEVRDNNVRVYTEITVAASRNPEAIAKDIAKRFLPKYLAAFERALAIVEAEKAYELHITNALKLVADAAGITVPKTSEYDRELRTSVSGRVGSVAVYIKTYDGCIELKLDGLTTAQAIDVLAYVRGRTK